MLRFLPHRKRTNRYDDLLGIVGGFVLLGISWLDAGWAGFWMLAGVVMIIWSVGSFLVKKLGR